MLRSLAILCCTISLAACGEIDEHAEVAEVDPAVAKAIMAPILADPDLIAIDRRFAILSDPGPIDAALPPDDFGAPAVAAAREEARRLVAGAPEPVLAEGGACPNCSAAFVEGRAALLGPDCAGKLQPNLEWSLRLPPAIPIYPKSHLREAAGGDEPACRLSAASFTAPVPPREVLAFYRVLAAREGYALAPAGPNAFVGRKGEARLAVTAFAVSGGFSRYDLIATR